MADPEQQQLLVDENVKKKEKNINDSSSTSWIQRVLCTTTSTPIKITIITALVVVLLFNISPWPRNKNFGQTDMVESNDHSGRTDELLFTVKRDQYDPLPFFEQNNSQAMNYVFLEPYIGIVEPFAEMVPHVYNYRKGHSFLFRACLENNCEEVVMSTDLDTHTFKFPCAPFATLDVQMTEFNENYESVRFASGKAICLYVRREIRSLTTKDLHKFMDAAATIYSVSELEGQRKYGNGFHSQKFFTKFHHYHSSWQSSDHFHEGNGFLAQHIKITNYFDEAIRAVDPSVSLPYWDFSIDEINGHTSIDSFITGPTKYGSMQYPANGDGFIYAEDTLEDARIKDGRWSNLLADMDSNYSDLPVAGYGYMRAAWNMNPSPYVSRFTLLRGGHTSLPGCDRYYSLQSIDSMMDYLYDIELLPHGAAHVLTGGMYGCDMFLSMLRDNYLQDMDQLWNVCSNWFIATKELYRSGYITPKSGCIVNTTDLRLSSCGYTCEAENKLKIYPYLQHLVGVPGEDDVPAGAAEAWASFICEGDGSKVYTGDHLESASPADPSFWVIHPTLERILHAKLIVGGFSDESWPSDPMNEYVCNKARCLINGVYDYYDECCYGHYEYDRMYNAVDGVKTEKVGPTNRDTMDSTDPRKDTYSVPYVYEHFRWDHCPQDFDELYASLLAESTYDKEATAATGRFSTGAARKTVHSKHQIAVKASKAAIMIFNQNFERR